jgi:hypothetical protein
MTTGITMGNAAGVYVMTATLTPAATAANTCIEQSFTVASTGNNTGLQGLRVGDYVDVTPPSITNGVGLVHARVSANGTLTIAFQNSTAGSLTAPSGAYQILVIRPESATLPTIIAD